MSGTQFPSQFSPARSQPFLLDTLPIPNLVPSNLTPPTTHPAQVTMEQHAVSRQPDQETDALAGLLNQFFNFNVVVNFDPINRVLNEAYTLYSQQQFTQVDSKFCIITQNLITLFEQAPFPTLNFTDRLIQDLKGKDFLKDVEIQLRSLAIRMAQTVGNNDGKIAVRLYELGQCFSELEKDQEALVHYSDAYARLIRNPNGDKEFTYKVLHEITTCYQLLGNSLEYSSRIRLTELAAELFGSNSTVHIFQLSELANYQYKNGQLETAYNLYTLVLYKLETLVELNNDFYDEISQRKKKILIELNIEPQLEN